MRFGISILLFALFGGVASAGPADCCDPAMHPTPNSSCHHVPARPAPCDQVQLSGCPDFVCEPELSSFATPLAAGIRVSGGQFSNVLSPDPVQPGMPSAEEPAMADHVANRYISGKLFLRNRVLLI